jgi:hypothetical protein
VLKNKPMHPNYKAYVDLWQQCYDCSSGQQAVKNSPLAAVYLPYLEDHTISQFGKTKYETYKQYANYFNATGRTVDGLRGLVFRRDPVVNVNVPTIENDIDLDGTNLKTFLKKLFDDVLIGGRAGVLIDSPRNDSDLTVAEAEALNVRPYLTLYNTFQILDWQESRVHNKKITTYVCLEEVNSELGLDYTRNETKRLRILELLGGVYTQSIYQLVKDKGYELIETITPLVGGTTLDYVPFYPITSSGISWELWSSSIADLSDCNLAHYRNDASYRNALLLTGNPTPWLKGVDAAATRNPNGTMTLGSTSAIFLNENGGCGFLSLEGSGLAELRQSALDLEKRMAVLGARILSSDPNGVESAKTAEIHRAGENGVLADLANGISTAMTTIITDLLSWVGVVSDDISIELNTDYLPTETDPAVLTALMGAYQSGMLSFEAFYYNLKKRGVYPVGWDQEVEKSMIEKGAAELIDDV